VRGGCPEAVFRSHRRRGPFFDSYLTTLIERDVRQLSDIERRSDLRRLLALLAGRAGNLLVPATLANQSGMSNTTVRRYPDLLSAVFVIKVIPAWTAGGTGRAIGTPKLAFVDSGVVCHLLKQDPTRLAEPTGAAGPMVENFVLMELARQLTRNEVSRRCRSGIGSGRCRWMRCGGWGQRGRPEERQVVGPGRGTPRRRAWSVQSGRITSGAGGGDGREARTVTRAASSSGVGLPRTTRRTGAVTGGCFRVCGGLGFRVWGGACGGP
jgi:hypothetical protein